jgi:hypothetical protein
MLTADYLQQFIDEYQKKVYKLKLEELLNQLKG